jgi:hypothetical protein
MGCGWVRRKRGFLNAEGAKVTQKTQKGEKENQKILFRIT